MSGPLHHDAPASIEYAVLAAVVWFSVTAKARAIATSTTENASRFILLVSKTVISPSMERRRGTKSHVCYRIRLDTKTVTH